MVPERPCPLTVPSRRGNPGGTGYSERNHQPGNVKTDSEGVAAPSRKVATLLRGPVPGREYWDTTQRFSSTTACFEIKPLKC